MLSDRNRCQLRLSFPLALHTVVLALFTSTHALAQYKLSPSDSLTRCSPTDITVTSSQPPVELQIQAVFPNGDKTLVSTQQFNSDGFTYPFTPTFQVGFSIQISAKDGSGSTNTNYFRITNSAGIACGGDLPADPSSSARLTATDRSISTSDTSLPIPTRPSKPSPARPPAITSSGASSDTSASFETTLDSSSISPASSVLPSSSQPPALLSPSFDPTSHPDSTTPTSTSSASVASGSATSSRDPAPSSTATIRDDSTSNSHSVLALSKGGTAGIAIGCVVLAILAFLMCLRQKRRRPSTGSSTSTAR
ncbi:hypothetical protein C8Q80DRAFT_898091 [Daedaleopsis nitida]|nr:hypothetical protein C8Q80DRAFT_898091 [Daedaleopsis nitida]